MFGVMPAVDVGCSCDHSRSSARDEQRRRGIDRWRHAVLPHRRCAMRLKIGAATVAPYGGTLCGESTTTTMVKTGLRDGTKPTNETL
jgi:hypothetical protein